MGNSKSGMDLSVLREGLRHGDVRKIAKDVGVSDRTVHYVLSNERFNKAVLEAIVSVVKANQALKESARVLIGDLT